MILADGLQSKAIIGYTGFVGGNLCRQTQFTDQYNSKNFQELRSRKFDLLVCAGARAEKWLANKNPGADLENIQALMDILKTVSVEHFVLISTVDVYRKPFYVFEDTRIEADQLQPYGLHRYMLEQFVGEKFKKATIIRLPGLFGWGLKKNFLFDMLYKNEALSLTHSKSEYQFYNLDRLWKDINTILACGLPLVNLATPPLAVHEISAYCFGKEFSNENQAGPVYYDMKTHYADQFGANDDYIISRQVELDEIRQFVEKVKGSN